MFTDNHMHTSVFSSDGAMTFEELLASSVKAGLPGVCITEHYDLDYEIMADEKPFIFDIDEYVRNFDSWRSGCPEGFRLGMGIEMGYQKHLDSEINAILDKYPFDSVVLSEHVFHGADIYYRQEVFSSMSDSEIYSEYVGILAHMAKQINSFDIIGHFDYIDRYNPRVGSAITYDHCPDQFDELFRALISRGKSLEINSRSMMKKMSRREPNFMPDEKLLRRYRELGGTMISLSSDSHTPETIGYGFAELGEYLKTFGFKGNTYFVKHEAGLELF